MRHNQIIFQSLECYQNQKYNFNIKIKQFEEKLCKVCWSVSNIAAVVQIQQKKFIRNESLLKSLFKLQEQDILEMKKINSFFSGQFCYLCRLR
ncbi:unnamed protein product [Paramecium pentaurelia]|uniref:Uncharacterized protein n=1 Tax=Paramecium pentaurelia TaxID=43138 RepID=A0A8S1X1M0_9CILI|nr:unnamed protein product [Paramecium pentaurelia]